MLVLPTVPYVTVASFRASPTFLDSKTLDIQYGPAGSDVIPAAVATVVTGSFV